MRLVFCCPVCYVLLLRVDVDRRCGRADTDEGYNGGRAAVQQYGLQYKEQVYAVTVASEALYRGNFTGDELAEKILEVKSEVPDFKVGTADSWNKYADGTADPVIRVADILCVNGVFCVWAMG